MVSGLFKNLSRLALLQRGGERTSQTTNGRDSPPEETAAWHHLNPTPKSGLLIATIVEISRSKEDVLPARELLPRILMPTALRNLKELYGASPICRYALTLGEDLTQHKGSEVVASVAGAPVPPDRFGHILADAFSEAITGSKVEHPVRVPGQGGPLIQLESTAVILLDTLSQAVLDAELDDGA